jgi:hypothetical protein
MPMKIAGFVFILAATVQNTAVTLAAANQIADEIDCFWYLSIMR